MKLYMLLYCIFSISGRSHISLLRVLFHALLRPYPISYFLRGEFPKIRARGSDSCNGWHLSEGCRDIPMHLLLAGWRLIIITLITIYYQYAQLLLTQNVKKGCVINPRETLPTGRLRRAGLEREYIYIDVTYWLV